MTNFLTRRPNNDAKKSDNVPQKQKTFAETMAAIRKASCKAETRVLSCCCAKSAQLFLIVLERFSPSELFRVARIDKQDGRALSETSLIGKLTAGRRTVSQEFDAEEVDLTGANCPWCGNGKSRVICTSCGYIVCGASRHTNPDGSDSYVCHDACGDSGRLITAKRIPGSSGGSGSRRMKSLTTGNKPKRLNSKPFGLLGGPRK